MKKVLIKANSYYDSATLMSIAQQIKKQPGITEAVAVMGTVHNKELLANVGLLTEEAQQAQSKDLIIAVNAESAEAATQGITAIVERLQSNQETSTKAEHVPTSLQEALSQNSDANLVLISVPGQFAVNEARQALLAGKHVMLFSDNVSLEDELKLKQLAQEKQLLMMGPDCGTAIVNGAPLAFANRIRSGKIGIVAAAGTGLQEVSTLIHRYGGGISQGLGTGGRDVKDSIGGLQMLQSFQALIDDPQTEVIVLVSKPLTQKGENKILELVKSCPKPVVVNFLGGNRASVEQAGGIFAGTLEAAAQAAVSKAYGDFQVEELNLQANLEQAIKGIGKGQRWLRALYTGGTLCYEALLELRHLPGGILSNTPLSPEMALEDSSKSRNHTALDLGEDEFTKGRPHPMIEPSLRGERILQEVNDPEMAVLLLDFVIGYGAHAEPVEAIADQISTAMEKAKTRGGKLIVVASVTGTDEDPQVLSKQVAKLQQLGVWVFPSNNQAVKFAAMIIKALEEKQSDE